MKYLLFTITIFLLCTSMELPVSGHFKARYSCKKYIPYDSTQRVEVRDIGNEGEDHKAFEEQVNRQLFGNMFYTFQMAITTYGADSATLLQHSFKYSQPNMKAGFTKQQYLLRNDSLFREESHRLKCLNNEMDPSGNRLYVDTIRYGIQKVMVKGYACNVAHSMKDDSKVYYICDALPRSLNPGIILIGSKGAVLGIRSEKFTVELDSIETE